MHDFVHTRIRVPVFTVPESGTGVYAQDMVLVVYIEA